MVEELARRAFDQGVGWYRSVRALAPVERVLPDFLIIGAQKAGTSSLQAHLVDHPQVKAPLLKEIHYFDLNYSKGEKWYRTHFPRRTQMGPGSLTGEASPYYLFHPLCHLRIHAAVPDAKLIVMLRNPIDRAVSHFHHERRLGHEARTLEQALAAEEAMIAIEEDHLQRDPSHRSFSHQHHGYRARGVYADQLARYYELFDRDDVLLIESNDFYRNPLQATRTAYEFLGLDSSFEPHDLRPKNVGSYRAEVDAATREQLARFYEPHNRRLYDMIGREFDW